MITARINNNKIYNLIRWDAQDFNTNLTLYIHSGDLQDVKESFQNVELLEVFRDTQMIASYTSLDTFSQITYLGMDYCEAENRFVDSMSVTLTKLNIADQIQRLDDQINKTVDPTTLSLEDLRAYKLDEVNQACQADIFDGAIVEIDGVEESFSYEYADQLNFISLFALCFVAPEIEDLPYHSSGGHLCKTYSRENMIKICATLLLRKTQIVTYTNALRVYIMQMDNREDLLAAEYGMELPQAYQDNMNSVMGRTIAQVEAFMARVLPNEEIPADDIPDDPADPAEPQNEPEDEPIDDGQDEPDDGDDEPEDPGDESSDDEEE